MTLAALYAKQARRRRLAQLAAVCVLVLVVTYLAGTPAIGVG